MPEHNLTTRHEDRMDFIKVVLSVAVAVIVVAAVLTTAVLTTANRMLGESNRGLLATYALEQQNLVAAGKEQEQFALYLAEVDNVLCTDQALIVAKLGITGAAACPVLPHFTPLAGTGSSTKK